MGLFDDVLRSNETLIKNEAALDYEFLPKLIPYRESEQQYLATCLKPLFSARSGRNVFIHGPPGIGKTAAVRHILRELEEQTDDIIPIFINCWQHNTSYKILVEICEQAGYRFTQNKKTTELFKVATTFLNKKSVVFVFDEVDKTEDLDFLYLLIEEIYRKSIFLITNYKSWLQGLDERIRSRLPLELSEFKQYTPLETEGILKERLAYAFQDDVWTEEAFSLVCQKTAKIKDIRTGLYLLRESALSAEDNSRKQILLDDVKTAIRKLDDFSVKNEDELDDESKEILELIKQQDTTKIGDLFKQFEESGGKTSYKTFQRKIAKLHEGRYIKVTKQSGAGGNTTIIEKKLTDY